MQAAKANDCATIRKLLENEFMAIRVDDKDAYGWTAFRYAVRHQNIEAAQLLLDMGADIDSRSSSGRTAVMSCVGDPGVAGFEMFKLLVRNGARLDVQDNNGRNVLDWAKLRGTVEYDKIDEIVHRPVGCI